MLTGRRADQLQPGRCQALRGGRRSPALSQPPGRCTHPALVQQHETGPTSQHSFLGPSCQHPPSGPPSTQIRLHNAELQIHVQHDSIKAERERCLSCSPGIDRGAWPFGKTLGGGGGQVATFISTLSKGPRVHGLTKQHLVAPSMQDPSFHICHLIYGHRVCTVGTHQFTEAQH